MIKLHEQFSTFFMIFLASIMVSRVYIDIMMTRILLAKILSVKMVKNHEKPLGENISVILNLQNGHNFPQN